MTEEQATKLVELLETYNNSMTSAMVMMGCVLLALALFFGWELYRMKKISKMHREYYASLTEEQKKAVNQWKEYNI